MPLSTIEILSESIIAKRDRLVAILGEMSGVAVAFSGGVDSAVVAKAAVLALGKRAVAVTADSASVARTDLADALRVAAAIDIRHEIVATAEFANPDYAKNDGSRCYHCKTELYDRIAERLPALGCTTMVSGANLDDAGDYRPGLVAAAEHSVRHPLQEAGFTKADVRAVARDWNLPVWDKPASPCLSSRLAPGVAATPERTARIAEAEAYLRTLGLVECRVRYHDGDLARIEVPIEEIARLAVEPTRSDLTARFRELGFRFVTLDLLGFRSGGFNELIPLEVRSKYEPARRGD